MQNSTASDSHYLLKIGVKYIEEAYVGLRNIDLESLNEYYPSFEVLFELKK
jgi:hypothetical protein